MSFFLSPGLFSHDCFVDRRSVFVVFAAFRLLSADFHLAGIAGTAFAQRAIQSRYGCLAATVGATGQVNIVIADCFFDYRR
ncbi:hypothetical protein [Enterobacter asburiae]|uniref:hypothetical protein n=1 Tax=Enterobacter asburiae TaxID=61645 RepID=UPI0031BBB33E